MSRRKTPFMLLALLAVLAMPLHGQDAKAVAEADVASAARAVENAAAAGAAVYAPALFSDARDRLAEARTLIAENRTAQRERGRMLALEAMNAAIAAEEQSRWIAEAREFEALRADVVRLGGTVPAATYAADPPETLITRGATSAERVKYSQAIYDQAVAAGARNVSPDDMQSAKEHLEAAARITRRDPNHATADYLAYTAEMMARRAMYEARRRDAAQILPGLRMERTRLAEAASLRSAEEERLRRLEIERQASALQEQLARESAARQMRAEELEALRRQVEASNRALDERFERDRAAVLEAERELERRLGIYSTALGTTRDAAEIERLRREVEDQRRLLTRMGETRFADEQTIEADIRRLRESIERDRRLGFVPDDLNVRESELRILEQRLATIRSERSETDRRLAATTQRYDEAIARADALRSQMERETAELREQMTRTQAQLEAAQVELRQRREAEETQRREFAELERSLSAIASARTDSRGLIVTLPGIFFDTGSATLKPGARRSLEQIAEQLTANPTAYVVVEGHTDSVGGAQMNQRLSEQRAAAVRNFLAQQGVPGERIATTGRGQEMPIATNATPAGRQQNRRVELIITERQSVAGGQ
jgi:outer membrane protein OmpA-like peptidoglycan-associated protein